MQNKGTINQSNPATLEPNENSSYVKQQALTSIRHQWTNKSTWWLDFYSTSGRKSENQDSLLITTCLLDYFEQSAANKAHLKTDNPQPINPSQPPLKNSVSRNDKYNKKPKTYPVLAVLADGVSACQFPKQASRLAVEIFTDYLIKGLTQLQRQASIDNTQLSLVAYSGIYDDDKVAGIIKSAINKANDSMYFSQAYQRVAPLLSTISGVLCIGDRVHTFHTGDSRIYRISANNLTLLTKDHRIHHGQDKGALSAALGADARVELQQSVFTIHQDEYLALMTDGVYEFVSPMDMQFEFTAAIAELQNTPDWNQLKSWHLSEQLCQQALNEGSNDNLSIIMLAMGTALIDHSHQPKDLTSPKNMLAKNSTTKSSTATTMSSTATTMSSTTSSTPYNEPYNMSNNKVEHDEDESKSNNSEIPFTTSSVSYKLPTGLNIGDYIDGFVVKDIIARTARSEVYLVKDSEDYNYVLKSPSLMTVDDGHYLRDFLKERKIGLSLSRHSRAGEPAYNQNNPNYDNKTNQSASASSQFDSTQANQAVSKNLAIGGSSLAESGLLRYYPVPASTEYLYHLTEYIEGESLRAYMERNGPCDVWQTHDLLTKIGMAIRVMHRNYLLHQDIKPENILLTKSGAAKLIDFGSVASSILKENTRPPVGDLHYSAPEYYTDAPKGVHSDLFSIAVIGFELLTGSRPFTSQMLMSPSDPLLVPTQLLRQHQVPATSQQALIRALHRNTNARHQAIGEFLQDFNPDNSASLADPEPLIKRNPLLVWHGICLIQSIIIIFLLFKYLSAV